MNVIRWADVLPGEPPDVLRDLPCQCWTIRPAAHHYTLSCLRCKTTKGWYRGLDTADLAAAKRFRAAIKSWEERNK